jgi:hypothetical protein
MTQAQGRAIDSQFAAQLAGAPTQISVVPSQAGATGAGVAATVRTGHMAGATPLTGSLYGVIPLTSHPAQAAVAPSSGPSPVVWVVGAVVLVALGVGVYSLWK